MGLTICFFLTSWPAVHYYECWLVNRCKIQLYGLLLIPRNLDIVYIWNSLAVIVIVTIVDNIDSSGVRFTLTSTPRQFNAGVAGVGAEVNTNLFVPPNTDRYDIYGYCPSTCTSQVCLYKDIIQTFITSYYVVYSCWRNYSVCQSPSYPYDW